MQSYFSWESQKGSVILKGIGLFTASLILKIQQLYIRINLEVAYWERPANSIKKFNKFKTLPIISIYLILNTAHLQILISREKNHGYTRHKPEKNPNKICKKQTNPKLFVKIH